MTNGSRRKRLILLASGLIALAVIVAGCGSGPSNGQNSLRPSGEQAHKIDNLFLPVVAVAAVIFVLVAAAVVYAAIKFRARPGNERPRQTHGHTALEIGWT